MRKRLEIEKQYPFYWLDSLAEITLNPEKNDVVALEPQELTGFTILAPRYLQASLRKSASRCVPLYLPKPPRNWMQRWIRL